MRNFYFVIRIARDFVEAVQPPWYTLVTREGIRIYEKQGTPPCGALNSYIWNRYIGEIADEIEDIALLRVEELNLLYSRGDSAEQMHCGKISKEQRACAELRSIKLVYCIIDK